MNVLMRTLRCDLASWATAVHAGPLHGEQGLLGNRQSNAMLMCSHLHSVCRAHHINTVTPV